MNLTKSIVASVVTAIVVVSVALGFYHPTSNPVTVKGAEPVMSSPYFTYGGITEWRYNQTATTASTTCSILSPAATTTLVNATAYFTALGSTTPVQIGFNSVATSTNGQVGVKYDGTPGIVQMSTSTAVSNSMWLTTAGGFVETATTSPAYVIPPYTFLDYKLGRSAAQLTQSGVDKGNCTAIFREFGPNSN